MDSSSICFEVDISCTNCNRIFFDRAKQNKMAKFVPLYPRMLKAGDVAIKAVFETDVGRVLFWNLILGQHICLHCGQKQKSPVWFCINCYATDLLYPEKSKILLKLLHENPDVFNSRGALSSFWKSDSLRVCPVCDKKRPSMYFSYTGGKCFQSPINPPPSDEKLA